MLLEFDLNKDYSSFCRPWPAVSREEAVYVALAMARSVNAPFMLILFLGLACSPFSVVYAIQMNMKSVYCTMSNNCDCDFNPDIKGKKIRTRQCTVLTKSRLSMQPQPQ